MLQIYNPPSVEVGDARSTREVPSSELSLADLLTNVLGFIRRQFLIILSVLPLTVGLAVFYLNKTPPSYYAHGAILLDTEKVQVFKQSVLGENPISMAIVDSQIEILKSDNFGLSVVKKLNLAREPEFVRSGGLIGRAIDLVLYPFNLLFNPSSLDKLKSESDVTQLALQTFQNRMTVVRVGLTYVIEIGFRSINPDRAAEIVNAIEDEFIVEQVDSKYQTIGRATDWLQNRLNELQAQAAAAERAVVEYKVKNNIVDTGGKRIDEQQLSELNTALVKARAGTVEAKARLDRVSQILGSEDLNPTATEVATVADALHNETISKFRQQYLELAQREAMLSERVGHDHLAVVNLRSQMREISRSIFDEFKRIAQSYRSEYDIAKARENSLQGSWDAAVAGSQTTNKAQIELRQLESATQSYRLLYDSFQQRYTDFVQQQSFPMSDARVTRALPPSRSSSPNSLRILALAVAGGLGLGLGIAALREIFDQVFRTSRQVEARLKTECIALLPMIKPDAKRKSVKRKAAAYAAARRNIEQNSGLLRYIIDSPLSPFAESMRAVKVAVDLDRVAQSNKVIGITSSLPNEGKSTIAASLAQVSAHGGARVILVDCDLRKPTLSPNLTPKATLGLLDVLGGKACLDDVIWSDPSTRLSFLPGIVRSRIIHTSDILASAATKRLFDQLRENYDYVIVDLPPLAPVVDARSATHFLDCYLFVVEWGKTRIGVVEHALTTARGVYDNLLGVVLNKVNLNRLARYESNHGQSYYSAYYAHYGYTD
jgi:succinoglycan biosynthesis transport protein ExoP